jgi:hypothetical protein
MVLGDPVLAPGMRTGTRGALGEERSRAGSFRITLDEEAEDDVPLDRVMRSEYPSKVSRDRPTTTGAKGATKRDCDPTSGTPGVRLAPSEVVRL